jgi:hypothetical protein
MVIGFVPPPEYAKTQCGLAQVIKRELFFPSNPRFEQRETHMVNVAVTWLALLLNIWVSFMTNGDWQTAGSGLAGLYWSRVR